MAKNVEDPGARLRICSDLKAARRRMIKRVHFCGRFYPLCGHTPPTASPRLPTPSSRSIAPCEWASTGSLVPLNFGTQPESSGVARMKKEGRPVAANVEQLLAGGKKSWYLDDPKTPSGKVYFDLRTANYDAVKVSPGVWSVEVAKKSNGVVKKNSGPPWWILVTAWVASSFIPR